jgi:hypothetical protein
VSREGLHVRWLHIGILMIVMFVLLSRFLNLPARPMGNDEAVLALNALQLTPSATAFWPAEREIISRSPLYEWLTGFVFQYISSGAAQARLVPAAAGALLALLPLFFLKRMSKLELILTSAFLAFSPVAINLSRAAGGYTLSALFLTSAVLVATLPRRKDSDDSRWIWSSIFLGASFASGVAVYNGLFSLLLGYLLIRWRLPEIFRTEETKHYLQDFTRYLWLAPVVAILAATGVGSYRFGMAGIGEALAIWLKGWVPFGKLSLLSFLMAGITYEPFILIVGAFGAIQAWRRGSSSGKLFSIWALASLMTGLIYPARSAQDWIWVVIPLAFLAAEAVRALLNRLLEREAWNHVVSLVVIALILIGAAVVTLLGYVNGYLQQMLIGDGALVGLALLAMLLLLSSVFVLFGLGWSWEIVFDGASIVILVLTSLLSVSAAWNLANDRGLEFRTLWVEDSPTENGKYFERTLENASLALTGEAKSAAVFVKGELEPSLVWALRENPRYDDTDIEGQADPPVLIAPEGVSLVGFSSEYLGQNFALNYERGWYGLLPPDLLRWYLTHSAPTASASWVIFVRADIIEFSEFQPQPAEE